MTQFATRNQGKVNVDINKLHDKREAHVNLLQYKYCNKFNFFSCITFILQLC
jgi:hypothetical protein